MSARTPVRDSRSSLALLALAQVLASTAAGATITVVAPTLAAITGSDAMAGWGQTSTIVGAACLSVPVARMAARYGRRVSLASGFGVAAIGAVSAASGAAARAPALVLAGLAAVGAGTVAALALRYAAADAAGSSGRRARAVGLVLAGATLGSLIGPNLAGWTGAARAWSGPYLLIAATYAGAAAASFFASLPSGTAGEALPRREPIRRSIRRAAAVPILIMVAGHAAMIALMGLAPLHLMHADVPTSGIGWVMSAHLVAMYAASPLFGSVVRRFGALRPGLAALPTAVVACSLLAAGNGGALSVGIGLVILGLAWSLGMVACSVALAELPAPGRLQVQGRGDLALNLAAGAASLLAGVTVAVLGYELLAVLVAVCLGAVMVVAAALLRSGRAGRSPGQAGGPRRVDSAVERPAA